MNTGNISIKASVSGNTPGLKGEKGNGIKSTVLNDDYSLTFNYTNGTSDTTPPIRGQKGEKGDNGISPSITTSKSGKVTTITIKDATGTKVATINDGVDSQGDMLKSTYDKNSNGIVDNSEKVNGHTVESNVPANAKFTDTIYTHPINSGNKHIPSGGSSGQILKWEEDGTAKWDDSIEAHREGTELKVNNYKQLIKFTKEGKTEQKSYTEKNLLNYIDNLQSISGLTNTINSDGSITTTGKPTANFTRIVKDYDITNLLEDGQKYTISQTDTSLKTMLQITAYKNDGTITYYSSRNGANVLTINKSIYTKFLACVQTTSMSLWGDESLTINNKYMLCKGTDTADTSFEPYVGGQPSPNPDYPQQIENIEGVENIWFGAGSATVNGVTFTKNDDGSYDITGTATADANCYGYANVIDSKLVNNKVYTISINKLYSSSVGILTEALADSTWVSHAIPPLVINNNISNYKYITIPDNVTKIRYGLRVTKGTTVDVKGLKIQLEEGTIAHTFVLPRSNYLQLENKSKNILPHSLSQGSWNTTSTNTRVANYSNILIKPGTYTFSTDIDLTNYVVWVGTSTQKLPHLNWNIINEIKSWSAIEKITFTIEKESYFLVMYRKKDDSTITPDEIKNIKQQLEIGPEATEFEPYQKKIMNIDLKGNNLCSNKEQTLKDELVIENGRAKIIKKYDEYVFTGNETFSFTDNGARIMSNTGRISQLKNVYISIPQSSSNITPSFCTHYTVDGQGNVVKGSNKFGFSQYDNAKFIYFPADYSTIEEFKAKLKALYDAGTPVIVQYPLSEPEIIDLGKVDLDLLENSTLTCDEESDMQIDYLTIDSNIFVQDSLDGSSSQKAPSVDAVNEIISKLEARIIALENKNV